MNMKSIQIELKCHECGEPFYKNLRYLLDRVRKGKTKFFCGKKCANTNHSKQIRGKNNPNFNGKYHGIQSDKWSEEKWEEVKSKISKTIIERGTSKGSNNGRWSGGKRIVNCVECGAEYHAPPYSYRKIESGELSPHCKECAIGYARTFQSKAKTSIEIKMAEELNLRQIKYTEQYNLGNKFSLDFFLPEYKIVIECDGDYWHTLPEVALRDKSKNAYINACGFTLFRFWEHEINTDAEACVDIVMVKINELEVS